MTKPRYPRGCPAGSQESRKAAARDPASYAWNVNFDNGNVNWNNRNNQGFALAVRRVGEFQGAAGISLRTLYEAWRRARRQKRPSHNQLRFDAHWGLGLLRLQRELNAGNWRPRRSTCFIATRPKAREIHAPDFADRVAHHCIVPALEQVYEPTFIADSYANRVGKGSHAAVRQLHSFTRQVASGQGGGWFLQLDIANFFNSIHRETLWLMLKARLERAGVGHVILRAVHALLRRPPLHAGVNMRASADELACVPAHKRLANAAPGCGLPIGNLSSQFLANVYLDALDQFVKHELKAKRYLRYVDDFVIVHHDRAQLVAWRDEIERFLRERLRLTLKADEKLRPLADSIDFLGYIVRPSHLLVRRRVVAHACEAFATWEHAHVVAGEIRADDAALARIRAQLASYEGHFAHASSFRLRASLRRRFPWIHQLTEDLS